MAHDRVASSLRPSEKDVQHHLFAVLSSTALRNEIMPYSPEHKRDTREKILESARRLFNRKGYSGVSIEQVMKHAGLTHGGFYRHFTGRMSCMRRPFGSFCVRRGPQVGKSGASRVRSPNPTRNGSWMPISHASTSMTAKAAARCSARAQRSNGAVSWSRAPMR